MPAPSTLRSRAWAWRSWETWCAHEGHPALPADPELVADYLVWLAGRSSMATVDAAVAALRATSFAAGHLDPTMHYRVRWTRADLRRDIGASRRPVRRVADHELAAIVASIRLTDDGGRPRLGGVRDRALLLVGAAGSLRPGQLAGLRWRDVDARLSGVWLRVRAGQARTVVVRREGPAGDPVDALEAWRVAVHPRRSDPVFVPVSWKGRPGSTPLSSAIVSRIVARRAAEAGFPGITGDGLRPFGNRSVVRVCHRTSTSRP